jgi:hypothetical protein
MRREHSTTPEVDAREVRLRRDDIAVTFGKRPAKYPGAKEWILRTPTGPTRQAVLWNADHAGLRRIPPPRRALELAPGFATNRPPRLKKPLTHSSTGRRSSRSDSRRSVEIATLSAGLRVEPFRSPMASPPRSHEKVAPCYRPLKAACGLLPRVSKGGWAKKSISHDSPSGRSIMTSTATRGRGPPPFPVATFGDNSRHS